MISGVIILFLSALLGGILAIYSVSAISKNIKYLLVFAGSFLFSITILHILPEIFEAGQNHLYIGLSILLGFFFQQLLEYFTNGVEHGHMHKHHSDEGHSTLRGVSLMLALCVHGFLEGTLLAHPDTLHESHTEGSLLAGIVFHKFPAALALISVLACQFKSKKTQFILLTIFALASPFGLFTGHIIENLGWLSASSMTFLFAFVAGNFLHISTTIFIESSPEHKWSSKKLLVSVFAAGIAFISELFF